MILNINFKKFFENKYFILSIFFLCLQILIIIRNLVYSTGDYQIYLYGCDHFPIILSIAFYLKNIDLVKAIISVGLILQLFFIVDVIHYSIFGTFLNSHSSFEILYYTSTQFAMTLIMHLSIIIALLFTYMESFSLKYTLYYIFIYTVIIQGLVLLFSSESRNINCVFDACKVIPLHINYKTSLFVIWILFILPVYFLQHLIVYLINRSNS